MREALSNVPLKGSFLKEILFEPGVRLSLKLLCPSASAGAPWAPAEYQLQFHRISEGAFDVDIANNPQEVIGYEVEPMVGTSSSEKRDIHGRTICKIRLQLERGYIEIVSEGFTLAPLQPLVSANRSPIR